MDYILKMENIFKSFFGVYANEDVSLFVKKGEIHLLASSANTAHAIPYFSGDKDEFIKRNMLHF